ncbi:MAG TPA: ChaN family lipoprotein, partial [Ottowia sp.]|nr:ChaN family lipoprotein [Ottowia sp.]
MRRLILLATLVLAACALPPLDAGQQARLATLLPTDALLLGEQHDAPEHQHLQRQVVQWLGDRGQLAAVVLEMAEGGRSTAGLPRDARAHQVRAALGWDDARWPWRTYGPVIMA